VADPEQENVKVKATNMKVMATRHMAESIENVGTLQSS
jgi:hypothetical protein